MAYTKYSLTPSNNNAAPPDGAPEGMLPSAVNDTMRDMMAQIRDCGDGIRGGTYTMNAPVITGGSISGSTMSSNVITGGSINNTPIGASTANTGAFTTLAYSSTLTGGTGVVNLGSGQFYKDASGNIGLGTTSPQAKLHTVGAMLSSGALVALSASNIFIDQTTSALSRIGIVGADTATVGTLTISQYSSNGAVGRDVMRIDSSGNVGIGTNSPSRKLEVSGIFRQTDGTIQAEIASGGGVAFYGTNNNYPVAFQVNAVERMRIDSSGSVGIGTTPTYRLDVRGSTGDIVRVADGTNADLLLGTNSTGPYVFTPSAVSLRFGTSNNERMRIDSSGNLLVGTTSASLIAGAGIKLKPSTTVAAMGTVMDTSANNECYVLYNLNATNNGYRFYVTANGGIYNYSGNNANLSDERTKTNIEFSGGYLTKICSIPVKLFNYRDEIEGEQKTLGVIAQDVEAVAPELVNNAGFGETTEGEPPLKSIYTTDMMFALMKAVQEQQVMIEELKAKVAALEAA